MRWCILEFPEERAASLSCSWTARSTDRDKVSRNTCIKSPDGRTAARPAPANRARMAVLHARGLMKVGDGLIARVASSARASRAASPA